MKKNIAKLLVLVIAISLFSGCANKNKIGDELKTIKLWSGYCMIAEDELEMEKSEWILTKLVDKYNEIQDDIRVEFSYFDDDDVTIPLFLSWDYLKMPWVRISVFFWFQICLQVVLIRDLVLEVVINA